MKSFLRAGTYGSPKVVSLHVKMTKSCSVSSVRMKEKTKTNTTQRETKNNRGRCVRLPYAGNAFVVSE